MLMTAAVADELSRLPLTKACCRRAETITLLRFAGTVHQQPGRWRIEVDLDTPLLSQVWAPTVIPAASSVFRSRAESQPGLSSTTVMAKNVAVMPRARSCGNASVIWLP